MFQVWYAFVFVVGCFFYFIFLLALTGILWGRVWSVLRISNFFSFLIKLQFSSKILSPVLSNRMNTHTYTHEHTHTHTHSLSLSLSLPLKIVRQTVNLMRIYLMIRKSNNNKKKEKKRRKGSLILNQKVPIASPQPAAARSRPHTLTLDEPQKEFKADHSKRKCRIRETSSHLMIPAAASHQILRLLSNLAASPPGGTRCGFWPQSRGSLAASSRLFVV